MTVASTTGGAPTLWAATVAPPVGTAPAPGSAYWGLVVMGTPLDSALIVDAKFGALPGALQVLTDAVTKAQVDATAAKTAAAKAKQDAQAALAEAEAIRVQHNAVVADLAAINNALKAAGVAGFPVALTATTVAASSAGTGTAGSGSTGTSGGTTGSGSTGTTYSGPSGATTAAAASNRTSGTGDTITAATTAVTSAPAELCYAINVTAPTPVVTYRYTDGSTWVRTISGSPGNNGDGTYTFIFSDGGSDRLVYSGTGNSATGLISTGSTSDGHPYLVGTGVPANGYGPFVEAAANSTTGQWYGILSSGQSAQKGGASIGAADAHGNITVTFGDGTTFTHS